MTDILERLRGVDHMNVDDCFLQSSLFGHAADTIERLRAELAALREQEPVAWRCKDFADGWILYNDYADAFEYEHGVGCAMQPLYAAPVPAVDTDKLVVALRKIRDEYKLNHLSRYAYDTASIALASHESNTKPVVSQNQAKVEHKDEASCNANHVEQETGEGEMRK